MTLQIGDKVRTKHASKFIPRGSQGVISKIYPPWVRVNFGKKKPGIRAELLRDKDPWFSDDDWFWHYDLEVVE